MNTEEHVGRSLRVGSALLIAPLLAIVGCATQQDGTGSGADEAPPAAVTVLPVPAGASEHDRDRIALARFVGAWDYEGWYDPEGAPRESTEGIAAGMIEHDYFVRMDARSIRQADRSVSYVEGTMLLSVEPGLGLMLTSWSNAGPSVQRFRGGVERSGTRFVFDEVERADSADRLRLVISFETDNRWTADFYRRASPEDVLAASYAFDRAD